jgi:hypothetical protein
LTAEVPKVQLEQDELPKKKRGRQSTAFKTVQNFVIPEAWCTMMCALPYDWLANKYGEHWRLSETELLTLSTSAKPVMDKWLPQLFKNYPEEGLLAIAVIMITLPRLLAQRNISKGVKNDDKNKGSVAAVSRNDEGKVSAPVLNDAASVVAGD